MISCILQDIKALFHADHNPCYAGFGNRDTDEVSHRKIGIPKGKIFIINPKVRNDVKDLNEWIFTVLSSQCSNWGDMAG